jgi:hypothetical protein
MAGADACKAANADIAAAEMINFRIIGVSFDFFQLYMLQLFICHRLHASYTYDHQGIENLCLSNNKFMNECSLFN